MTIKRSKKTEFTWTGITADDKKVSGQLTAESIGRAQNQLLRHRIRIVSLTEQKQPRQLIPKRFSQNEKAVFFNQFATLLQAGIPILNALDVICKTDKYHPLSHIRLTLRETILSGNELAAGFEKCSPHFNAVICQLIRAGEQSGTLVTQLSAISSHLHRLDTLNKTVINACFYPVITLIISISISLFMLMVITPRFAAIFQDMHIPLPAFTRAVLFISNVIRFWFWPSLILCIITVTAIITQRDKPFIQRFRHAVWVHIPIINTLIKKSISARVTRTLSSLLQAGIPLTQALSITAPIAGNHYDQKIIQQWQQSVSGGRQLHESLLNDSFVDPLAHQMIRAGEESGTLPEMLKKASLLIEKDLDHTAGLLGRLLEPLIMLILGALIGTLVVAMYLPIFKLGNVI